MGKNLEILQAAVDSVCYWFDRKLTGTAKYAGNNIELRFTGYALYPTGIKGDVIIHLPSDYITISSAGIKYRPVSQKEIGFYQEKVGTAFVHPHVWASGQPCWDHQQRKSIIDLFVNFTNTMLYTNANAHSLEHGRPCPDSRMYNSDFSWILREVAKQQATLRTAMSLPRDIFDTKFFNVKFAKDIEEAQRDIMKR